MKRVALILALALAAGFPAAALAKAAPTGAAGATMVKCASGDAVVWLNTDTKVYHAAGSSLYGKTKHGKYVCTSDATKLGARPAKSSGGAMSGSMSSMSSSSAAHTKKKKDCTMKGMAPGASPSPM